MKDIYNLKNRINEILKEIRNLQKEGNEKLTWERPVDIFPKREFLNGKSIIALNVTLIPSGCEWASKGGCTYCGEYSGSKHGKLVDAKTHIAQFATTISKYMAKYKPKWLRIYNEGNFLNDREIEEKAQEVIIGLASMLTDVERITIETKACYLNERKLNMLKKTLYNPTIELEIAIGLEAKNELVKTLCINKGEENSLVKKSVELIKNYGFRTLSYITVKPPFLTEKESLEEAIESVKYAFEIGFDAVSIEPMSIHSYSFLEALYIQNLYKLPWLWTIVEIIKKTHFLGEIRLGGLEYYPRPEIIAHNYDNENICSCTYKFWKGIEIYNATHDIFIFDLLNCNCKKKWKYEIEKIESLQPLEIRVHNILNKFSLEAYKKYLKENY